MGKKAPIIKYAEDLEKEAAWWKKNATTDAAKELADDFASRAASARSIAKMGGKK